MRRPSVTSNRSQQSTDTLATTTSGAQSSIGHPHNYRTRVIPLYNLDFHTILPTSIVDAGTDERVAKVTKRGMIELENFAVLEPTELILGVNDLHTLEPPAESTMPPAPPRELIPPRPLRTPLEPVKSESNVVSGEEEEGSRQNAFSPTVSRHNPFHPPTPGTGEGKGVSSDKEAGPTWSQGVPTSPQASPGQTPTYTSTSADDNPGASPSAAKTSSRQSPFAVPRKGAALFGRPASVSSSDGGGKFLSGFKRLLNTNQRNSTGPFSPNNNLNTAHTGSSVSVTRASSDQRTEGSKRLSLIRSMHGDTASTGGSDAAGHDLDGASITTRASLGGGDGIPLWPVERKSGSRRALGYIWTVRRWLRPAPRADSGTSEGLTTSDHHYAKGLRASGSCSSVRSKISTGVPNGTLESVWAQYNLTNRAGGHEYPPPARAIPIRIEWTRESARMKRERQKEAARASALASLEKSSTDVGQTPISLPLARSSMGLTAASGPRRPREARDRKGVQSTLASSAALGRTENLSQQEVRASEEGMAQHASLSETSGSRHCKEEARRHSADRSHSPRSSRPGTAASLTGSKSGRGSDSDPDLDPDREGEEGRVASHSMSDSGSDSDPEDSERPWRCALVLGRRTRVPLGVLTPAPHHPKVVGQLLIPYPAPDLRHSGLGADGLGLSPEELKDITVATSLHLVIREGFGALSKAKR